MINMFLHFTAIGFLSHVRIFPVHSEKTIFNIFEADLFLQISRIGETLTADQAAADRWDSGKKRRKGP